MVVLKKKTESKAVVTDDSSMEWVNQVNSMFSWEKEYNSSYLFTVDKNAEKKQFWETVKGCGKRDARTKEGVRAEDRRRAKEKIVERREPLHFSKSKCGRRE